MNKRQLTFFEVYPAFLNEEKPKQSNNITNLYTTDNQ